MVLSWEDAQGRSEAFWEGSIHVDGTSSAETTWAHALDL